MNSQKLIALIRHHPLAAACILVALTMVGLAVFRSAALADSEDRYARAIDKVDEMEQNEKNAIGLEEDVEKINELVTNIDSRLMVERARADHYRYFLSLAEASKVNLTDPSFSAYLTPGEKGVTIMTQQLSQVEYRLRLDGDFNHILDFLYRLTNGHYLIRVDGMTVIGDPSLGPGIVQVKLVIRILATPPPKEDKKK